MTGIVSYGAYIPTLRIDRKIIADQWERGSIGGERSVANNDEDSITMAVEATINALNGIDRSTIDGLFFATTTAPYQEKMNASLIAAAVDLERSISTADYANSLRSGMTALKSALDAVKSGSNNNLLAAAADYRLGYPKSDHEQTLGDGAGAVLIGNNNPAAVFEGAFSVSDDIMDMWRNPEDKYGKSWEGRFILQEGYTKNLQAAIKGLLAEHNLSPENITKIIVPGPDARTHSRLVSSLGFDVKTQMEDPLITGLGYCGAGHPLIMLIAALETAKPGDLLLLAAYGDGADAFLFRVTEQAGKKQPKKSIPTLLEEKKMLTSYAKFLSFRSILEAQPGEPFRLLPSVTSSWRERNSTLRCRAGKCRQCGLMTFPIQRICYNCRSKDDFDQVRISHTTGEIYTFSKDNLAGRSDDPVVIQTVADFADGVRFYGLMTDCDPSNIDVGMPVGLTFRRFYEGAGYHNYFWKLKPILKKGD